MKKKKLIEFCALAYEQKENLSHQRTLKWKLESQLYRCYVTIKKNPEREEAYAWKMDYVFIFIIYLLFFLFKSE